MNEEPTDVGPAVGGDLAIQETDRSHVITLLTAATNEGRLPAPERDRRIEVAQRATTFDDLVPLTRDLVAPDQQPSWNILPAVQSTPLNPPAVPQSSYSVANTNETTQGSSDQMIAIFSGVTRRGIWRVKPTLTAFACFGGVELDLTEAILESKEIHINQFCMFGGLDIIVPRGMDIRDSVVSVFGGTTAKKLEPGRPDAPVIYIHGLNLFGGTTIKHPKRKN